MRPRAAVLLASILLAAPATADPPAADLRVTEPRRALWTPGPPRSLAALPIATLPFADSASTCGRPDTGPPPCTLVVPSPDVAYAYTPAADVRVDATLCGAGWDTTLYAYDDGFDNAVACNDDGCGIASRLVHLELRAGHTYVFVVDSDLGECGDYVLRIAPSPPLPECATDCIADAAPEGESVCAENYDDLYDSGCNTFPYYFRDLVCADAGVRVCGTYGTYPHGPEEWRDTDWYRFQLEVPGPVSLRVTGQAPTQVALLHARDACDDRPEVCDVQLGDACETLRCDATLAVGTYYVFVATRAFEGIDCGARYALDLDGFACPPIGAQTASWGKLKRLYR